MAQLFSLGIIHTLMKYMITLFTLSLLLAGCGKHLSDAEISRKAVGIWFAGLAFKRDNPEFRKRFGYK